MNIPMHIMLAEDVGGWLAFLLLFLGALVTSVLALGALYPAYSGMRWLTLALVAPAVIMCLVTTHYLGRMYLNRGQHDSEEIRLNYVEPWLMMGFPPFATSVLCLSILVWRRIQKTAEQKSCSVKKT